MRTTVGQLLTNGALPELLRDNSRVFTKKELSSVLDRVAKDHPDSYRQVVYELKRIGDEIATRSGSSFSLKDFRSPVDIKPDLKKAKAATDKILGSSKPESDKLQQVSALYGKLADKINNSLMTEGVSRGNTFALSVHSGARGSPTQLRSVVSAPLMVTDHKQRPILTPLEKSYAEGVDPSDYWAASYGTRQGVISSKFATAEAGAFGKQLSLASSQLVITENDCGTANGVPYPVDDDDNLGAYLARPAGGQNKDTLITPRVLASLRKKGIQSIVVRSAMTCEAEKGICQMCHGHTNTNALPQVGDNIGVNSAAALAEPIAQGGLNVRHTSGVVGGVGVAGGFKLISQLATVPRVFRHGATLAEQGGKVTSIEKAPQGGLFVNVGSERHYVPPGLKVGVKVGEAVEAGDALGDGIVNPADAVRLKGIGAGRKYFADMLKKVYDSDIQGGIHRRNFENVSRSLINHVQVDDDDEIDDVLPDDIVEYQHIQKRWHPKDAHQMPASQAVGRYLAKPYLNLTVGTKLTNSAVKDLDNYGYPEIQVTEAPPPFSSVMVRLPDVPKHVGDWQARLASTNLQKGLLRSVQRGETSDIHGLSYVPALAHGKEFGKTKPGRVGY